MCNQFSFKKKFNGVILSHPSIKQIKTGLLHEMDICAECRYVYRTSNKTALCGSTINLWASLLNLLPLFYIQSYQFLRCILWGKKNLQIHKLIKCTKYRFFSDNTIIIKFISIFLKKVWIFPSESPFFFIRISKWNMHINLKFTHWLFKCLILYWDPFNVFLLFFYFYFQYRIKDGKSMKIERIEHWEKKTRKEKCWNKFL